MAYLELSVEDCLRILGYRPDHIPETLIIEGYNAQLNRVEDAMQHFGRTWKSRLSYAVVGETAAGKIGYTCVYGAPQAIEVAWLFGRAGTKTLIVTGYCGGLQPNLSVGDFVLPTRVRSAEGTASYLLHGEEYVEPTPKLMDALITILTAQKYTVHRSPLLTWLDIILESGNDIQTWHKAGYMGVDMETGSVFAVAEHLQLNRAAMLIMVDNLPRGRRITDPFTEEERTRF